YATNPQEIACFQGIHSDTWDTPYRITDRFTLLKHRCDLLDFNPVGKPPVHVVFYDAFSPAAQPELWTEQALQRIVPLLAPEAVLTTYSCKGTFRRLLESLGFTTERLPGPGKKRHILRAVFTNPQI
ncbi:MAG TPA: MnmC family methyltransferase, partial [Bacteroidales bacterium]|nr:MnmC family methyltransferase [Bacteroidales bacterium]